MQLPYIILVLGYALLVSLFLWVAITIRGKWVAKFTMVPLILWFGLFMYYVPPQLAGYPSEQEIIQERVIVRYYTYQAPTQTEEGHIYVVVDTRFFKDKNEVNFLDKINPLSYTDISKSEHLRLYRIPWDDDLVKKMTKAQKKKQLIILNKNGGKNKGVNNSEGKKGNGKGKAGQITKKKKGEGKLNSTESSGSGEKGKGGTGGSSKYRDRDKGLYSIEALSPNEIFTK
jgi:hypothetical protein